MEYVHVVHRAIFPMAAMCTETKAFVFAAIFFFLRVRYHNHVTRSVLSQVAALTLEVNIVHARLGALNDFNYRMSEDDVRLSWRTMEYPTVRLYR